MGWDPEDALDYFDRYHITWWGGEKDNRPTSLIHSSQVACINHLYWLRSRQDAAFAVLNALRNDITCACIVDDGFVEFEVVGKGNVLGEHAVSRGEYATAFDALMVAQKVDGENLLVAIEWKYTEELRDEDKLTDARREIYDPFLRALDCPILTDDPTRLYRDPFYQLMRETLLAWQLTESGAYGANEYIHVNVTPKANKGLRSPSTKLGGDDLESAWRRMLKDPDRYVVIDPQDLLTPAAQKAETKAIMWYLAERYWASE